jgi:hypothetical protein
MTGGSFTRSDRLAAHISFPAEWREDSIPPQTHDACINMHDLRSSPSEEEVFCEQHLRR